MPPALVEMLPPIWAVPSAPSESGNSRFLLGRHALDLLQHDAGLDRHRVVHEVDLADGLHARERDDDLVHALARLAAVGEARVAALRHDRGAPFRRRSSTIAATSSVVFGRITSGVAPCQLPRQLFT